MKKVNFNKLKSVKTPENWIENAVKIPKRNKKKPIYLNPYLIASAACFVFCCVLCAVIFLSFGTDMPAPIVSAKLSGSSVLPTVLNPITDTIPPVISQQPTGSDQKSNKQTDAKNGTETGRKTKNSPNSQSAVTNHEPSESKGNSSGNTSNSGGSTIPDTPVTEPTHSVSKPTVQPTTEHGISPTEDSSKEFVDSIYFCFNSFAEEGKEDEFYCHITSESGQAYSQKFSSVEKAAFSHTAQGIALEYNPFSKGLHLMKGTYNLTFYDKNGSTFTYSAYLGYQPVFIYL